MSIFQALAIFRADEPSLVNSKVLQSLSQMQKELAFVNLLPHNADAKELSANSSMWIILFNI